jgi:hypothetical protein
MKTICACMSVALLLAACGKPEDSSSDSSSSDGGGSKSSSTGDEKPWDDLTKPYLSDKNMGNFIESLKDANGPFDAVSKGKVTALNMQGRMNEFEASAKKHGFASGDEYLGAWMRINATMMQVMQDDGNQSMINMHEASIRSYQETLKKPEVTPEMRQVLEDQIKNSNETLEALKQPREGGVNAKDIETFKKHKAAFEEAMKKWS